MTGKVRIAVVIGTRPEAIKLAPVVWAAQSNPRFEIKIIRTGQHRDLVEALMQELALRADVNLDVTRPNQQLSYVLAESIRGISAFLAREQPDWLLVQGDTTSALAGAMAAFHAKTKVGHVEAGLRTGDRLDPFPEEVNRELIARLADLHFVPTPQAKANLLREAIASERIVLTGNTIVDAIHKMLPKISDSAPDDRGELALVTVHRRENLGRRLDSICAGLLALLNERKALRVELPMHPNPKVRATLIKHLGQHPRILLQQALGYIEFLHSLNRATLVITDSGGVQEECAVLGRPALVIRDSTERPEAVLAGVSVVVGTDPRRIMKEGLRLLDRPGTLAGYPQSAGIFGDGRASLRILGSLGEAAGQPQAAANGAPEESCFSAS